MATKVEKVVVDVATKIAQGEWYSGMKLPSQQQLSSLYGVNRSTVVEALSRLKTRGIIVSHQGKGTFVTSVKNCHDKGEAVVWNDLINWSFYPRNKRMVQLVNHWENDSNLIQLSKGVLSSELMPSDRIQAALQEIAYSTLNQEYGDGKGDWELRKELSDYLNKKGIQVSPEGILIVSGALNGIQLICTGVLQAGSTIYHEPLSYLHTLNVFDALGLRTKVSPISTYATAFTGLKKSAHCFYTNPTYANPDGRTLTEYERLSFLAKMRETSTPVIEDDIYSDLYFDDAVKPIKAYDQIGQVLYVGSFSKTLTPALRVGWVVGPQDLIRKLADLRMQTDYGSSIVSQAICKELLRSGEYEAHILELRAALKKRELHLRTLLDTYMSEFGRYNVPKGGFFIWYTFDEAFQLSSRSLALLCRKKGVVINPGFIYGERGSVSIRLSFAYETEGQLEKGIQLLKHAVEELLAKKRRGAGSVQKLMWEDAWDRTIAPKDRQMYRELFQTKENQEKRFIPVREAINYRGDLLITVIVQNFSDVIDQWNSVTLDYVEGHQIIAEQTFSPKQLKIPPKTSMPWTFIFPKHTLRHRPQFNGQLGEK